MTLNEVRTKYLEFFKNRPGYPHAVIPSASLVPENDPTTLFTGSGMQPLVPYLLGQQHPAGKRLVNSQKCFRSEDIEEVGDNRHTTFFEMLGNWSLGDYWKEEQLAWFFEFVTKEIGISKDKLWVTCFEGDEKFKLPRDTESAKIWEKLGLPKDRIIFYGKKNWWSRAGVPENMPVGEPGGPDSEMFYEFTQIEHDKKFGEKCHPNCDCGRFMEIGNSVFMEYRKTESGFEKLTQRNVDFGGGLERITAASNNEADVLKVLAGSVFEGAKSLSGIRAVTSILSHDLRALRIIADHFRAAIFLIADGITPSNV
ncbi:MAG: alanine--tRNA ligase-related protein, partial [bacterium]|nr:alanine--tRNA ligase-related protein [bacterium]